MGRRGEEGIVGLVDLHHSGSEALRGVLYSVYEVYEMKVEFCTSRVASTPRLEFLLPGDERQIVITAD
jgi:hypothetical protein